MAFEFAGNLYGNSLPLVRRFQIGETCYVGQLLESDKAGGGDVRILDQAAATPDTANNIVGICTAVVTDPTYNSTYRGDTATLDTSQAAQVANDPVGATEVIVTVLRPGDMVRAPVCATTYGTAPSVLTASSAVTDGLSVPHTGTTLTTPISHYATVYCRTGANKGLYRKITTGGTKTQTLTIAFPYDVAAGDTFVATSITLGECHFQIISTANAFEAYWATNYFVGYCHEINLEEAGKEYAVISIHPNHLMY